MARTIAFTSGTISIISSVWQFAQQICRQSKDSPFIR